MPTTKVRVDNKLQLLENVSAISASVHEEPVRYRKFYDRFADTLSGFSGIWSFCAQLGELFTKAEEKLGLESGEDFDWIAAIGHFSDWVLNLERVPKNVEILGAAENAIRGAKF